MLRGFGGIAPGRNGGQPLHNPQVLDQRRNALALCGAAHIASIKLLGSKLLAAYTTAAPPELGLRPPSLQETQAADKALGAQLHDLIDTDGWGMEDALHEITPVRNDLQHLMQPAPTWWAALP